MEINLLTRFSDKVMCAGGYQIGGAGRDSLDPVVET